MDKKTITKADIILAIILLIIGIGSPFLITKNPKGNAKVEITIDGSKAGSYSLDANETIYVIVKEDFPFGELDSEYLIFTEEELNKVGASFEDCISNKIEIKDGKVFVEAANCSGQDCVKTGSISKEGEVIACLPHKLMINISSSSDEGADVVVY